jgi:uncharacterized protein
MRKKLKRATVLVAGIVFIFFGLIGLVLPFLQGILFLAIGLILLSLWSPKIREFVDRHTIKYPKIHKVVREVETWVVRYIGET